MTNYLVTFEAQGVNCEYSFFLYYIADGKQVELLKIIKNYTEQCDQLYCNEPRKCFFCSFDGITVNFINAQEIKKGKMGVIKYMSRNPIISIDEMTDISETIKEDIERGFIQAANRVE